MLRRALQGEQPNILIYLSDDHSQFDSSLYGNANIPTPNFEALASSGMTFTHAFVASPSCAPSRAAMLTGLMPARNGAEGNHTYPRDGTASLIKPLQESGYEVAAFGKVAHGKSANRYGFDHISAGGAAVGALKKNAANYLASRQDSRPLCLFVGTSNPHVAWTSPTEFDTEKIELPPHHLDTPSTRAHRAAYYQEIKELDELLGDLRTMAEQHLGKNTLFIHTSDHGAQWPFGKWNLYDYGTCVPFIAAWPEKIAAGSKTDAMISWVDLLPTLIDITDAKTPADLDGRSFADVLLRNQNFHRDVIFTTHTGDVTKNIFPIRSVRTRELKLIHNLHPKWAHTNHSDLDRKPMAGAYWHEWAGLAKIDHKAKEIVDRYFRRPQWELYDVTSDKWEQRNLIDDPKYATEVTELKATLADWMKSQNDTGRVAHEPRRLADRESWHPDSYQPPPKSKPRKSTKRKKTTKPNVIVIFTDDQGWADLGCQNQVDDIRTPHIDALAGRGVRCTAGYVTSPQCSPSRAGLITGRHQQRFGIDTIPDMPLPPNAVTIAERLNPLGYKTGFVGKWHLEPNVICVDWLRQELPAMADKPRRQVKIPWNKIRPYSPAAQGFDEYFWGELRNYRVNYELGGGLLPTMKQIANNDFRIDVQTQAAVDFIDRNHDEPFYLQLNYYGPHTPLKATKKYLDRFPGEMPTRRRYALAMISAIDDGVGRVVERLRAHGQLNNTLIVLSSDNGAPLKKTKPDSPIDRDAGGWDGSLNDPWVGEKGMLSEGGIRVPMIWSLPSELPSGKTYEHPVSTLDIAPSVLHLAGGDVKQAAADLDGVNMISTFNSEQTPATRSLYFRFWDQAAIRRGKWKYLYVGAGQRFLFDLESDQHETQNLIQKYPELTASLHKELSEWADELSPAGLPKGEKRREQGWYEFYFDNQLAD